VGSERYSRILRDIDYGNHDISGAPIDWFWLEGNFNISAEQQVEFLRRLYLEELPFSKRTFGQVKDIMFVEKTPNYTIRAKTARRQQENGKRLRDFGSDR